MTPLSSSIESAPPLLTFYRCRDCGKLLCKGALLVCVLEIKCKRCGRLQTFSNLEYAASVQGQLDSILINASGMLIDGMGDVFDAASVMRCPVYIAFKRLGYPRAAAGLKDFLKRRAQLGNMDDRLVLDSIEPDIRVDIYLFRDGYTLLKVQLVKIDKKK